MFYVYIIVGYNGFFRNTCLTGFVGIRCRIITSFGEGSYKGLYSIAALVGLILIIYGKSTAG